MHARVPTYSGVAAVADHAGLFTFACSPQCAMFTFTSAPFCVLRALVWHHCDTQLLVRDLDETGRPTPEESFFCERGELRLKVLDESRSNFPQQRKHRALQLCAQCCDPAPIPQHPRSHAHQEHRDRVVRASECPRRPRCERCARAISKRSSRPGTVLARVRRFQSARTGGTARFA